MLQRILDLGERLVAHDCRSLRIIASSGSALGRLARPAHVRQVRTGPLQRLRLDGGLGGDDRHARASCWPSRRRRARRRSGRRWPSSTATVPACRWARPARSSSGASCASTATPTRRAAGAQRARRHRRRRAPRRRGPALRRRASRRHDRVGRRERVPGADRGGAGGSTPRSPRWRSSGVPDAEFGQRIVAFVVLRPGQVVTVADLEHHVRTAAGALQGAPRRRLPRRAAAGSDGQGAPPGPGVHVTSRRLPERPRRLRRRASCSLASSGPACRSRVRSDAWPAPCAAGVRPARPAVEARRRRPRRRARAACRGSPTTEPDRRAPTVERIPRSSTGASPGTGPVLVLLNGWSVSGLVWPTAWVERLSKRFRVVRIDNRGTGWSRRAPAPYAIADLADDVVAVLDAIGADPATVLGLSMGGMIAQELALRSPERVERLFVVASRPPAPGHIPAVGRHAARAVVAPVPDGVTVREHLRAAWARACAPGFADDHPELIDEMVEQMRGSTHRPPVPPVAAPRRARLARHRPVGTRARADRGGARRPRRAHAGRERDAPRAADPRGPVRRAARRRAPRAVGGRRRAGALLESA